MGAMSSGEQPEAGECVATPLVAARRLLIQLPLEADSEFTLRPLVCHKSIKRRKVEHRADKLLLKRVNTASRVEIQA